MTPSEFPCDRHGTLIEKLTEQIEILRQTVDRVRDRPPVWVTFIISLMALIIGLLVGMINGGQSG